MTEEEKPAEQPAKTTARAPKWIKRIGKLMVLFTIIGLILLAVGAFILQAAIDNALSSHGF